MTRGKFVLITEKAVYVSTEFNGDMYPDGHGLDVMNALKDVNSVYDFNFEVSTFNSNTFEYGEKLVYKETLAWFEKAKDFRKAYYDNWFSDFLYIKNLTGKVIVFTLDDGSKRAVIPFEVAPFNFGNNLTGNDFKYLKENFK